MHIHSPHTPNLSFSCHHPPPRLPAKSILPILPRKILASPVKPPSLPDLSGAGDYNLIIIDLMATIHF